MASRAYRTHIVHHWEIDMQRLKTLSDIFGIYKQKMIYETRIISN